MPSHTAPSAPGPRPESDDTRIAFSNVRCSSGTIDRARASSAESGSDARSGR